MALSKIEQTSATLQKISRENGALYRVCWKDNDTRVIKPASGESLPSDDEASDAA